MPMNRCAALLSDGDDQRMPKQRPGAVLVILAALVSASFPQGVSAKTLYVTNHGATVDSPAGAVQSYRLQDALDLVEPGDTVQLLGDGNKPAVYRAADVFRLTRGGEIGRPITIKGQVLDGEHLTIVRGGCLEETRRRTSGAPPPRDQLPPCPSFGVPAEAMAAVAAPGGTEPEEAPGDGTPAKPENSFLETLYSASGPPDDRSALPAAVEDQVRSAMCFMLADASWVVIEDLHFQQCWLPAILILGGSYITVRNSRITGSSYAIAAFPLNGKAPHHLLIERNHWIQDVSGKEAETAACTQFPGRPECAGMMWHSVPFWVTHGGTWEPYNGALFGGKGIFGSVIVRNNILRNAFNGIRIEGMRCDDRDRCLREDVPCSLERPCNVNVEVHDNDFFFIRDNPVEIEGWAANWRIHGNSFVSSHSWLSMDGMQGGPVYVFGNTGTFDSIPGTACQDTWWHDQKLYDYRGEPPGWVAPQEEMEVGCGMNSIGKALKFGATENEEPIYVFNNSWRLRGPVAAGGVVRQLRHWNNAIEFCMDKPGLCLTASPGMGATASGVTPDAVGAAGGCGAGLMTLYAGGQEFLECINLPPRADGGTSPVFDFDLTNVGFPVELRDLGQEQNGRPRPDEEPSRRLFVDGQAGDYQLLSPARGCRIGPAGPTAASISPEREKLECVASADEPPEVGAIQGSGERFQGLPYRHWSRTDLPDYPEHPRPVAAVWMPAGAGLDLRVEFTVPITLISVITASLPEHAPSQSCTVQAERTITCHFPDLDAVPDPATMIDLGAGVIARGSTCAQRLPATDWGAQPPQIRIAVPLEPAARC